jgi:hypothetical protein
MGFNSILHIIFSFVLMVTALTLNAQEIYRVEFTDKSGNGYSISSPEEFLSGRAIDRRSKQGIIIDEADLPVSRIYLDSLKSRGVELLHTSKWFNWATVVAQNSSDTLGISEWDFIKAVKLTKPSLLLKQHINKNNETYEKSVDITNSDDYYGLAGDQLFQLKGDYLHQKGFRGEGKLIAVIDGGFYKADELAAFDSLWINKQIAGVRDFVNPESDIFSEDRHGMNVLSVMGGVLPGEFVGVAPDASYLLLRSEDESSEYPVEMDNWIAAVEFADSAGADIVNSSLGYFIFDEPFGALDFNDLDGESVPISKAAQIAVDKGMVVCISAGNEGDKEWQRIVAPSDGEDVLSVAATDLAGQRAAFSSIGTSADGRVKPDVAACGKSTSLIWTDNSVYLASGTSFSSPLIAGLAGCLWQAFPHLSATDIVRIIRMSGSQADTPDAFIGYGVADFQKASEMLENLSAENVTLGNKWDVYPNPFKDRVYLRNIASKPNEEVIVMLYNSLGVLINSLRVRDNSQIVQNYGELPSGLYFLQISSGRYSEVHKVIKSRK